MNNDKEIIKGSIPVFIALGSVILVISVLLKSFNLLGGFVLGYLINILIFKLITITVDQILLFNSKMSVIIVTFSHFSKLVVYSLGFLLAVKFPKYINIFTVTIGYFVIKLSIFYHSYRIRKRGEVK